MEKIELLLWDIFYIMLYVDFVWTEGRSDSDSRERVIEWGRVVNEQGHTENVKG